jgi:hypothetical protein
MQQRDLTERHQRLTKLINSRASSIEMYSATLLEKELSEEIQERFKYGLYSNFIEIAMAKYSLGYSFSEIGADVEKAYQWFIKRTSFIGECKSLDGTDKLLNLLSLLLLLDKLEDKKEHITNILASNKLSFPLVRFILSGGAYRKKAQSLSKLEAKYTELISACAEQDDDKARLTIKSYLAGWYQSRRSAYWWGEHASNNTTGYFGYWCFTSAAVAKIKGLNLTNTSFGEYFPYSFFALPEQLSTAKQKKPQVQQNSATRIAYPKLPKLTLDIGSAWINESQDRLGLITHDEALECAGTVYASEGASFESFIQSRHSALVKQMPWYKLVGAAKLRELPIGKANEQLMQGVWQGESETTSYLVYALAFDQYFLGLTFTFMAKEQTKYEPVIEQLLASIRYQ